MNRNRVSDTSHTEDMGSSEVEQRVQQVFGGAERRSPRRRTTVAAVIAAAVLIAGVGVASARVVSNGPEFRTAVAGITDVASELTSVATIEPVTAAAVGFPADGTVESLEVAVGDTVTAGQELASLDETELTRTLNERNEALARAELDLSKALAGEVVAGATVERSGSGEVDLTGSATDSSATTAQFASLEVTEQPAEPQTAAEQGSVTRVAVTQQGSGQGSGSGGESELDQLQQAVLEAQQEVSAALLEAQAALDASDAVCD
ncbi:MAG: biotin/lipoyl-binding protein, partial [Acidimicrobiales bacterium]|nr:biotin/lipoyl-binding protein [Acidimicrobiales bacterium]